MLSLYGQQHTTQKMSTYLHNNILKRRVYSWKQISVVSALNKYRIIQPTLVCWWNTSEYIPIRFSFECIRQSLGYAIQIRVWSVNTSCFRWDVTTVWSWLISRILFIYLYSALLYLNCVFARVWVHAYSDTYAWTGHLRHSHLDLSMYLSNIHFKAACIYQQLHCKCKCI